MVDRPPDEKGFRLDRMGSNDRTIRTRSTRTAADRPHDERYQAQSEDSE